MEFKRVKNNPKSWWSVCTDYIIDERTAVISDESNNVVESYPIFVVYYCPLGDVMQHLDRFKKPSTTLEQAKMVCEEHEHKRFLEKI